LHKIITTICSVAIGINLCLFGVAAITASTNLMCLSLINIALLSSHFLINQDLEDK